MQNETDLHRSIQCVDTTQQITVNAPLNIRSCVLVPSAYTQKNDHQAEHKFLPSASSRKAKPEGLKCLHQYTDNLGVSVDLRTLTVT